MVSTLGPGPTEGLAAWSTSPGAAQKRLDGAAGGRQRPAGATPWAPRVLLPPSPMGLSPFLGPQETEAEMNIY